MDEQVSVGGVAQFVAPQAGLASPTYEGTLGSLAVALGRLDDSTLTLVVPEGTALGQVELLVDLGQQRGRAVFDVLAGVQIPDPEAEVTATFDAAELLIDVPAPAFYPGAWSSDSAFVAAQVAAARAAFAQLSPADQLEVARLMRDAGVTGSSLVATSHVSDAECAVQLTTFSGDTEAAARSTSAATALRDSPLKGQVMRASGVVGFIQAVLTWGKVGVICNMEENFTSTSTPTQDQTGTNVGLFADRRTLTEADADDSQNLVARSVAAARRALDSVYQALKGLFSSGEGEPSAPADPSGQVVHEDVPVEPTRVQLTEPTVQAPSGSTINLQLVVQGGKATLKALSTVRTKIRVALGLTVTRPGFAPKEIVTDVDIQPVCIENGQIFPGCVDRVEVTPETLELGVEGTHQLTAVAYDADNKVLPRQVHWSSDDESTVFVTSESGIIKALKPSTAPVKITARAGVGEDAREGFAMITVKDIDSTSIYRAMVVGSWSTVWYVSSDNSYYQTDRFVLSGDGTGYITSVEYYTGENGSTHGPGERPITWSVSRVNGQYIFSYYQDFWPSVVHRGVLTNPLGTMETNHGYFISKTTKG